MKGKIYKYDAVTKEYLESIPVGYNGCTSKIEDFAEMIDGELIFKDGYTDVKPTAPIYVGISPKFNKETNQWEQDEEAILEYLASLPQEKNEPCAMDVVKMLSSMVIKLMADNARQDAQITANAQMIGELMKGGNANA